MKKKKNYWDIKPVELPKDPRKEMTVEGVKQVCKEALYHNSVARPESIVINDAWLDVIAQAILSHFKPREVSIDSIVDIAETWFKETGLTRGVFINFAKALYQAVYGK